MATKKSPFQHMKSDPMTNKSQRVLIKVGEVEIDAGAGSETATVSLKRMAAPHIRALNKLLADFGSDARFELELKEETK